ncbi:MAG TPA: glycosyltransferase family 39 protein [Candidatus Binatia bacterium]
MTIDPNTSKTQRLPVHTQRSAARWLYRLSGFALVAVLFYQLGSAALFEPDEGRNAEKARQLLVLNDWITPHENFQAVLDKPMFFYWLIASAYALFGVSEWAARLPSALAALGCVALVYRFARLRAARWTALWSVLILLTSVEFFVLSRVVIFDMILTFFVTLALCSFYEAVHAESVQWRRVACGILYAALAGATLTKGLIGVAIPGAVIFFYLLLTRQWSVLRRIHLLMGGALFLMIVLPWYLAAEARNPGYLYYYFWQEHFGRFATAEFDRGEPWYYFIGVGVVGFFPWTLLLPLLAKKAWQNRFNDTTLYWIIWVVVPFMFFSASKSKMPHYILPIFPPLAMLGGSALVRLYQESPGRFRLALSLNWWLHAVASFYLAAGWFFPAILARHIRTSVSELAYLVWIYAAISAAMLVYTAQRKPSRPASQRQLYLVQGLSSCFVLGFIIHMMISVSQERSAKSVAQLVLPRLTPASQVVQYDTYLGGLPFYLRGQRPFWLITHEKKKRTFLGNYYAIGKKAQSAWGTVILNFDEFSERWNSDPVDWLIIVKEKNLPRLIQNVGAPTIKLGAAGQYLLVSKRPEQRQEAEILSQRSE